MKTGIIGGTFDPVHIAHLIIADRFRESEALDRCLFIPARVSPFKTDAKRQTSPEQRLNMLKLALKDNPAFQIDEFELSGDGISYTYKTIEHLREKYPDDELSLLIGADQAAEFTNWKNFESILESVHLKIADRPACIQNKQDEYKLNKAIQDLKIYGTKISLLEAPLLQVSSTEIRDRAGNGLSIKYLVPEKLEQYILENSLY
ncbi:MAG: nicotinate (nicotinamide) nucleotide adenylyltransferase [Candidatus Kapaibacterium sp.]